MKSFIVFTSTDYVVPLTSFTYTNYLYMRLIFKRIECKVSRLNLSKAKCTAPPRVHSDSRQRRSRRRTSSYWSRRRSKRSLLRYGLRLEETERRLVRDWTSIGYTLNNCSSSSRTSNSLNTKSIIRNS